MQNMKFCAIGDNIGKCEIIRYNHNGSNYIKIFKNNEMIFYGENNGEDEDYWELEESHIIKCTIEYNNQYITETFHLQ